MFSLWSTFVDRYPSKVRERKTSYVQISPVFAINETTHERTATEIDLDRCTLSAKLSKSMSVAVRSWGASSLITKAGDVWT